MQVIEIRDNVRGRDKGQLQKGQQVSYQQLMLPLILLLFFSPISATLYSLSPDYHVTYTQSPLQLAHANYQQKIYQEGWNYLQISTSPSHSLMEQHRAAGFLEGYITYRDIYSAFTNLQQSILHAFALNSRIHTYIDTQHDYVMSMIDANPDSRYWLYAQAYMEQLKYMHKGYLVRIQEEARSDLYLGYSQFVYLTLVGDLEDIIPAYGEESNNSGTPMSGTPMSGAPMSGTPMSGAHTRGNCNAYVKLHEDQLYIAHSTHNIYQFMLRTFKQYHFPTYNKQIGSTTIVFSSRPGDLTSKDDFYVLSSGLKVLQTSLSNYNRQNYNLLTPKSIPSWLRLSIANNLARTVDEWRDFFLYQSSGTHNNQWLIVDSRNIPLKNKVVLLIEEAFDQYSVVDMTARLIDKGFIGSYNMPFTDQIYKKLGYQQQGYNYENDPRAQLLTKYNKVMVDEESMKKWLLTNEEEDVRVGLAPRYDLYEGGKSAFGLTDCKIITPKTQKEGYIWGISGPTLSNGRFKPFNFSEWANIAQEGMPKVWDFKWQQVYYGDAYNG